MCSNQYMPFLYGRRIFLFLSFSIGFQTSICQSISHNTHHEHHYLPAAIPSQKNTAFVTLKLYPRDAQILYVPNPPKRNLPKLIKSIPCPFSLYESKWSLWSTSQEFTDSKEETNNHNSQTATTNHLSPNRKRAIRYRGRIAYDGTGFDGWQYQPNSRTVQGELESTLSRRFNRTVRVVGAGRTDAGVHARGQAFHFDLPAPLFPKNVSSDNLVNNSRIHHDKYVYDHDEINESNNITIHLQKLQHALNSMLSRDVRVWDLSLAPSSNIYEKDINNNPIRHNRTNQFSQQQKQQQQQQQQQNQTTYSWHAIASSTKKMYSYRFYVGPALDPIQRYTRAHIHDPEFNMDQLAPILQHFEGKHDFRAFSCAIEQNARKQGKTAETTDTRRTIYSVNVVRESSTYHGESSNYRQGDGNYRIDILLNGALYKMVRNIVGTAFDVCRGRISEKLVLDLLFQRTENNIENSNPNINRKILDRDCNPAKPAPPQGLTLEKVFFYDDF